ncbi:MAG: Peptidase [Bacteroidetes bacterium]|nr:Peptidase [Bacteroidota bacterium]
MKNKFFLLLTFISLCLCYSATLQAQTVDDLQKERKQIQERILNTNKQIKQTEKKEKASLNKLDFLKKNLKERKNLINNYSKEINLLDKKIIDLISQKKELEDQLEKLKQDYAKLIQKTQANRSSYSKLMFLLSSNNFDQTLRRVRYLQEFTNYRKEQVRKIEQVKQQIALKTDSLDMHKGSKMQAMKSKEMEAAKLKQDESNEKVLLAGLQQEEKKLRDEYRMQQHKRNEIDNRIEQIIAEEIRKAEARRRAEAAEKQAQELRKKLAEERRIKEERDKKAAEDRKLAEAKKAKEKTTSTTTKTETSKIPETKTIAENTSKPEVTTTAARTAETNRESSGTSSVVYEMSREESLLSGGFEQNRGRLPWPVDRGSISGHYGVQPHPVLKHVQIDNKGTYFLSPSGTNARAVFEGVVERRFSLPGSGNAVIIQHGNYRTLYGNLTNIYVRTGDHVKAKQAIGQIYTDEENGGKTELIFQIWSGLTRLNPENWITR